METSKSNFLIGLAIGSAIGALAQRFSRTAKAKMLKKKIHNAMAKIADRAESLTETVRDKALDASTKTADKVADATFDVAEKADTLKSKVHAAALEAKKWIDGKDDADKSKAAAEKSQKIGYYNKQLKLRDVFSMLPDPFHLN